MDIIYLLLPIAIMLAALIAWLFFWAVKSDQFEDMEGPAHRILMDDDDTTHEQKDQAAIKNSDRKIT